MQREDLADLAMFLAVAEERSFTRAAARLGTSQSALSHTIRRLEERLGLRLLARTTRSVAPTEAGERLLETLRPALEGIDARLATLVGLRDRPSGTVRINAGAHAAATILWPAIERLLPLHPGLRVEVAVDQSLADIVAGRFDAGIRLGEQVDRDMIAVPIGPPLRMVVVATPSVLERHPAPATPHGLTDLPCINLRLATSGGLYAWEFERDGRALAVRVEGPVVLNDAALALRAALAGVGVGFVMEDQAAPHLRSGRLVQLLAEWCPTFPGYHLYYPSRRQPTPAFTVLVEALQFKGDATRPSPDSPPRGTSFS